ncbi:MAG: NifU N-terminal domain-containing protein [Actinobacteria bacterium]|jgi:hypothetical protein|nr:NifU N-terminal domain-containing protein [Ilumatobacteraceae bacterium]MDA0299760.1 NifU N-terminal domain-containing protein [Actinomycetota bacterium]MDA2961306.1 NifU N-terminal domain-containing protein [Actinomycetota bacterium]MDA2993818.1 NifU N-terminal domain-containing protein [Actinomycetota bacterium]
MGQLVGVTEKATNQPGILRFELNRTLSGQGHERFSTAQEARGERPSSVLARRLIDHGGVDAVHVFSNIVTVELARGSTGEGLADIVSNLYQYWLPGVEPPSFEDLQPEEAAAPAATGDGGEELSAAAQRVPAHLLERSKAAKERWAAKSG